MIVADTNLVAYLLMRGQRTAEAESVYNKDPDWAAPILWRSELRNVLALSFRRGLLGVEAALAVMGTAEEIFKGQEHEVASSRVLRLAFSSGCSAYDCEFVALAQDLNVPLVTADESLISRFKPLAVSMKDFCS